MNEISLKELHGVSLSCCANSNPTYSLQGCHCIKCKNCLKETKMLGGSKDKALHEWNTEMSSCEFIPHPDYGKILGNYKSGNINSGPEWRAAEIRIYFKKDYPAHVIYGAIKTSREEKFWCINKYGWQYIIDETRYVDEVEVIDFNGNTFNLKRPPTKTQNLYFYIDRGWSTRMKWWYNLNIQCLNFKWYKKTCEIFNLTF